MRIVDYYSYIALAIDEGHLDESTTEKYAGHLFWGVYSKLKILIFHERSKEIKPPRRWESFLSTLKRWHKEDFEGVEVELEKEPLKSRLKAIEEDELRRVSLKSRPGVVRDASLASPDDHIAAPHRPQFRDTIL